MAHSILSQIKRKPQTSGEDFGFNNRVYQAMVESARAEVQRETTAEIEKERVIAANAAAEAERAQAEAIRAGTQNEALSATIARLREVEKRMQTKITALEKTLRLEQSTLTAKDLQYKDQILALETEIRNLRGTVHDLEVSNSRMQGQLETPKVQRIVRQKQPDPEFEIVPIYGGPENRIVSASVKVKR